MSGGSGDRRGGEGSGRGGLGDSRAAEMLVRLAARFVPADRRDEWREEWLAELAALQGETARGVAGLPGPIGFALGALPHALWTRTEGWTMEGLLQDVRYSARVLRGSPGFSLVATLTLALGIGANAAVFSLVNGLVLRPPSGIAEPERLVQVARSYESAPRWDSFSWPALKLIESEARAFSGVAGYQGAAFVLGRGSETERVLGQLVTGSYFEVLGVAPRVGRLLQPADDVEPGGHPVAVLSHALWTRRYGADPDVVGRTVQIGAAPYEVVGVAPEGFTGAQAIGNAPEIFVPAVMRTSTPGREPWELWGSSWINVFARLADGVDFEEARASMAVVSVRLREADPINRDMLVLLERGVGLDPEDRRAATGISAILAVIVGLVLLLACINVANLSLSRATTRRMEVGVRLALGAGRGRLARQLLTESALVAAGATLLAVPIVAAAGDALPHLLPRTLAVPLDADMRVYLFLGAVGAGTGLLFGAFPAWTISGAGVGRVIREGSASGTRSRTRLRDGLVVAQLALSLGLVVGASLLGRSVMNARNADAGFDARGLTAGVVDLFTTRRYDDESGRAFFETLHGEAERHAAVSAATLASQTPIAGGHSRATVTPVGRPEVGFEAEYTVVGPGYFEVMGIPIVRGRPLGGFHDEPERVVVVNEALAALFWPGADPIGEEIDIGGPWRVVGVAGDVQMRSLRVGANPGVYYPVAHAAASTMALHVRSPGGGGVPDAVLRELVGSIDPELQVARVFDLHAAMSDSMRETRAIGWLVSAFAALALVLATVGLYGLVAYGASQRVRELGIRLALGARPASLVRLVVSKGVTLAVLGVILGLAVSYGLGTALRSLLFGVTHTDVVTVLSAALVLLAAAAVAAWLPARRASRVDAVSSLRT